MAGREAERGKRPAAMAPCRATDTRQLNCTTFGARQVLSVVHPTTAHTAAPRGPMPHIPTSAAAMRARHRTPRVKSRYVARRLYDLKHTPHIQNARPGDLIQECAPHTQRGVKRRYNQPTQNVTIVITAIVIIASLSNLRMSYSAT
jgi:hypothetical protein